jgi:UDP-glucuronate 4-epimerase
MKKIIITGCDGMIGYNVINQLNFDFETFGIDRKKSKLHIKYPFYLNDLNDKLSTFELLKKINPDIIIHLAADTGISYSFSNPYEVLKNNTSSLLNILEYIRLSNKKIKLLYASSSSVYGNTKQKINEKNTNLIPLSTYGMSKLMNEQLSQIYYDNYKISSIGLRFFTVYGEYNRENMLMYYLLQSFSHQKEVKLFNNGLMKRDFTYVGDVYKSILNFINENSINDHQIFNI